MVFIFAKTPSDALAGLVKGIDKVVAENKSKKVAAVVNFTGEPTDDYREMIKEFGKKHNIKNVSLTTSTDGDRFRVNDAAEVTVMHYKGKRVKFNFAADKSGLNDDAVKAVVAGAKTILE